MKNHDSHDNRYHRFVVHFEHIMDIAEMVLSVIVMAGFVMNLVPMIREMPDLLSVSNGGSAYRSLLEYAFNLVVGMEFVKMLIKHTPNSALEVLLFAIARHMVLEGSGALDNLLSVCAIGAIFIIIKYVQIDSFTPEEEEKNDEQNVSPEENESKRQDISQMKENIEGVSEEKR